MSKTTASTTAIAAIVAALQTDPNALNIDALRTELRDNDVEFGNRSGPQKLLELALENDISAYAIGSDEPLVLTDEPGEDDEDEDGADEDGDGEEGGEDAELDATDEDEEPEGGNIVPIKYRLRYGSEQHCGDQMAQVLKQAVTAQDAEGKDFCSEPVLIQIADQNGVDYTKWAHLNIGQRRMNLGNVLRGKLNRGQEVRVLETIWEAKEPEEEGEEPSGATKMG